MLREDGFVLDDGTVGRLGRAALRHHAPRRPTRPRSCSICTSAVRCCGRSSTCKLLSVTEQWAQYSDRGPALRATCSQARRSRLDIGNAALPCMGAPMLDDFGGVPARLFRVSFSGELAYEIAAPGPLRRCADAGADARPAPSSASPPTAPKPSTCCASRRAMPAGPEFNGHTTARDLGLGSMMSRDKDYIGRVHGGASGALIAARRPDPRGGEAARSHALAVGGIAFASPWRAGYGADTTKATSPRSPGRRARPRYRPWLPRSAARADRRAHPRRRSLAREGCGMRGVRARLR